MRILFISSGMVLISSQALAIENKQPAHPPHQMQAIVVTASAKAEQVHDVMASIDVIDGKQLNTRYINDLSDALNDRTGIQQVGVGLNRKGISIRGMDAGHTLYLVDGQRINTSASAVQHSDGELNWIPAAAIDQIEVVRGPMSSLYGSEALGGVVNIITKKPTKAWSGAAAIQSMWNETDLGGDQFKSSVYAAGPIIDNKLGLNFWGEYRHRDLLLDPSNPQLANQDEQKNYKGHVGVFWQPTEHQSVDVFAEYGHEKRKDLRGGSRNRYYQANDEIERTRFGAKHTGEWDWGKSIVQLYQSQYQRDSERSDGGELTTPQKLTDQVASTQFQFDMGQHQIVTGNELRREILEDPSVNQKHKASSTHYGLYAQDLWNAAEQLKLGLGVRGDFHEEFGWELSPKMNLAYELNEQWTIKTGIGKAYRAPTLKQLSPEFESYAAMGGLAVIRGNPDLEPETNTSYELNVHFHQGNFETTLGWFRNNVDDLINTQRRPVCDIRGKLCLDYVNVAQAEIQGLEWTGSYQIEPALHVQANYTFLDAQDKTKNVPLADRSRHQFNTSVIWQANDALQLKLRQQYRSKQFASSAAPTRSPDGKPYTLWHIYADYQINPLWSINTGIENITDKKIGFDPEQFQTFTDAGRKYFVGINVKF